MTALFQHLLFLTAASFSVVFGCPNGFVRHDDSCYKVFPEKATWPEAVAYCKDFGLTLAKVESQREHDFLKNYVTSIKALYPGSVDFWLDGTNMLSGDWIWASTGEKIKQFFWHQGEPNNVSPGEHCLSMHADYSWDDEHCSYTEAFICEVEASVNPGEIFG
ncbi:C-type lection lectoxin-Enh3-like [Haliotis asinina]|uniref:C-type lection lectoxin-Enh3-like n=1 Tax=Haliotis asinina TaxID=109174 RepID=UPI0035327AC1